MRKIWVTAVVVALGFVAPVLAFASRVEHPPGRHVEVRGARLWVEQEGSGEPLLLIAGGPGLSHAYFHPWFSALRDKYRVIYFDAFGCGESSRPSSPDGYSFADDVENVEALRAALELPQLNVFGHSYGAMVAIAHAVKYPQSVRRLIVANGVASGDELQQIQNNWNEQFKRHMPEGWAKVRALRAKGVRASAPEHQEAYAIPGGLLFFRDASNGAKQPIGEPNFYNPHIWYAMGGADADFNVRGELRRFDARRALRELRMPMLVIAGRFDRVVYPALMVRYRDYAPRARFVLFEKSGHFSFIEEREATFKLLEEFLAAR